MGKVNFRDFVRQISKKTGYAQTDITAVLTAQAELAAENLTNMNETTAMKGVVIYPGVYPAVTRKNKNGEDVQCDEVIYPRARFGSAFKNKMTNS